jgi:sulfide:quinone oxidoreductase
MPIKCAGAPQKAMYLSCDAWRERGVLKNARVEFLNAGPVLFGVADYVPPLMEYVRKYGIELSFGHNLVKIDGPAKRAWFKTTDANGASKIVERRFDMIHVVPPQTAPDFIRASSLAADSGWVSVDQSTLRHTKYNNIYSLGDVMSAPNAKTAAAARKQAPVVAENLLADMGKPTARGRAIYDGYGSCPLTVERGKIVLAEFGYGGKRLPSFPSWFIDDLKPSRLAWLLKEKMLPPIYWKAMLKGYEPLAKPRRESN